MLMEMKKIKVPGTPESLRGMVTREGPVEFTFQKFVTYLLNSCKEFSADGQALRSGVRIEFALDSESVILREEDWSKLKNCALNPGVPYPCNPARAVVPYIDAIEDAERVS
jgi:hypothetical protein